MNWDRSISLRVFADEWDRTVEDRLRAMVVDLVILDGPAAIVTHGGVTVDLLRTLLGDGALRPQLIREGVPSCAVTAIEADLSVVSVASVCHLA
jgi:broad specificity phosphatase PhoE